MASSAIPGRPKMRILVPVNFSEKSEMALDFALTYAQGTDSEVYLFHVFEESTSNFRHLDKLNEEYMERMKQMALQAIERAAAKGIISTVHQVNRRMAHGKAPQEILNMADGIGADILIMGAPTASGFKKLAIKAPCTLVLVKKKEFA